ncbi:ABC transporter substrate-binding protein [Rhodopirellula sp. P2]|uniref:ABC transporter substrate-binding protein n=1 Tax=Rhodopirellula sp. P2 TaxID=2127060 RepID=UPI0023687C27|nr:substrate-binding domain-containing protein [Rhodopirellula sp. P2]WDQ18656.1 substrate-binding domain-containing protein [Rhodopirellula sp. P2]
MPFIPRRQTQTTSQASTSQPSTVAMLFSPSLTNAVSPRASHGQLLAKQFRCLTGFATIIVLLVCVGCQPPTGDQADSADKPLHFAVIPKGTTHIFWQSVKLGAEQAGDEIGAKITFRGPSKENDRDEQINVVQGFLNARVDGILLAPLDADALVRPVKEASRAGVPVVIFDSGLNTDPGDYVSYVATDNFEGGKLAAQAMVNALGTDGGDVILLRYQQGSESTHQREEGFLAAIAKHEKIRVISSDQYAGTTTESAIDKAQALLNRFGDTVDGICTVCEPTAEGALRALRERQLAGKVKLVTFDSSDSLRESLSAGETHAIVLQDPVAMGYQAVKTMAAHLRGETTEPFLDTGVFVATAENQDDETISRLLRPAVASE